MRAYLLQKHGKPAALQLSELPDPQPGPGQVRIAIEAIGLNYSEIQSRKGLYGWSPKMPYVLGMEAYGRIDLLGPEVTDWRSGDRVIVATQYGTYAEKIVLPQEQVLPALPEFSAEENAAFAVNYMTAWVALFELARARPTDTVLIQAAAGGVGTAAVQLAKKYGCTVFGTVGFDEKMERVRQLGIDGAINYRRSDFSAEVRRLNNGRGVDIVLEVVGGEIFRRSMELLNPFGRVAVMGFASLDLKKWKPFSWYWTWRDIPRVNISQMAEKSRSVGASHLGYLLNDLPRMKELWNSLTAYVSETGIRPVVGHYFRFDEAPRAHELMESGRSVGKIILKLDTDQ
ncbi:MAG: zinc-binding dehydrogenase [Candidatus Neomarinimicrobiota bacterium]